MRESNSEMKYKGMSEWQIELNLGLQMENVAQFDMWEDDHYMRLTWIL